MDAVAATLKDRLILVVDDEQSLARYLKAVLHKAGFGRVEVVHSGAEALRVFGLGPTGQPATSPAAATAPAPAAAPAATLPSAPTPPPPPPDLVLLDIMLPDVSGFDVCLKLKHAAPHYLPVVLMTGFLFEDDHARCVESGADDFLRKPIHPAELLARVQVLLRRKDKVDRLEALSRTTTQPTYQRGPQDLPHVGHTIDQYCIESTLSWSGSCIIYKAHDAAGGDCVVKILSRQALDHEDVVTRFRHEAEVLASVHHPNVVRQLARGTYEECPYYVMEYLGAQNLEGWLQEHGKLPFALVLQVAESLADALGHIHAAGIIHRDVKPKNIHLTPAGEVKLGDFGIAIVQGDLRLTQAGYTIGTPVYMAPEQFDGSLVGVGADIYSYGATLYHLITGRPPFSATNGMEMMRKHLSEAPNPMRLLRPEVPEVWDELVTRCCLAKKPEDRPASLTEIKHSLALLRSATF